MPLSKPEARSPSQVIWSGVAVAILMVALGFALRVALDPYLGDHASFLVFIPGVVAAAAVGGVGPGALATRLGVLASFAVSGRHGPLAIGEYLAAALFLVAAGAVVMGGEWFQRARRQAEAITLHLREREAHLQSILDTVPDAMVVIDEVGNIL